MEEERLRGFSFDTPAVPAVLPPQAVLEADASVLAWAELPTAFSRGSISRQLSGHGQLFVEINGARCGFIFAAAEVSSVITEEGFARHCRTALIFGNLCGQSAAVRALIEPQIPHLPLLLEVQTHDGVLTFQRMPIVAVSCGRQMEAGDMRIAESVQFQATTRTDARDLCLHDPQGRGDYVPGT